MCEYCNLKENESKDLDRSIYLYMKIYHRRDCWSLYAAESDDVEVEIHYCPICGRHLVKDGN